MKTKKRKATNATVPKTARPLRVGDVTHLDQTDCGLFEADSGNRYIVTMNAGDKVAIILRHSNLPPFTVQRITQPSSLERGRWWGPGEMEFTHALPGEYVGRSPGVVGMERGYAYIICRADKQRNWIVLSSLDEQWSHCCDFDGWVLQAEGHTFFEREPIRFASMKAMKRDVKKKNFGALDLDFGPTTMVL